MPRIATSLSSLSASRIALGDTRCSRPLSRDDAWLSSFPKADRAASSLVDMIAAIALCLRRLEKEPSSSEEESSPKLVSIIMARLLLRLGS